MATRNVLFCDGCNCQESESEKILPMFFMEQGKEWCFSCALKALREMYGLPNGVLVEQAQPPVNGQPKEPELSPETAAFDKRRGELATTHETDIYAVRPSVEVTPGQRITHGRPEREIEIIEKIAGKEDLWFAKVIQKKE